MFEVTDKTEVLEKYNDFVNLTPFGNLLKAWNDTSYNIKNIGKYIGEFLRGGVTGDVSDIQIDEGLGLDGFRYIGKYKGKPIYAASNNVIGRLLDQYGDPGHKSDKINYGAAFKDKILVNDVYVDSAAYGGKADPLTSRKLKYILEHELAELKGVGHDKAHEHAEKATGLSRVRF